MTGILDRTILEYAPLVQIANIDEAHDHQHDGVVCCGGMVLTSVGHQSSKDYG